MSSKAASPAKACIYSILQSAQETPKRNLSSRACVGFLTRHEEVTETWTRPAAEVAAAVSPLGLSYVSTDDEDDYDTTHTGDDEQMFFSNRFSAFLGVPSVRDLGRGHKLRCVLCIRTHSVRKFRPECNRMKCIRNTWGSLIGKFSFDYLPALLPRVRKMSVPRARLGQIPCERRERPYG